jgi:predicted ATPase/class 3 adenylate cyclase
MDGNGDRLTGTVPVLVMTDVEGSTPLAERCPGSYRVALAAHNAIIQKVIRERSGIVQWDGGDGFYLAFDSARSALLAAAEIQDGLARADWPAETGPLKVRIAVHQGDVEFRDGQFRGAAVHLTARMLAAAHGGQIVCSEAVARAGDGTPPLRRLGAYRMRGFRNPETLYDFGSAGPFPALRAEHARTHNLPAEADEFIGRRAECAELFRLLRPEAERAVAVLTGLGGIGKTRLALAVARRLVEPFENAVVFVNLSDLRMAEDIPNAILGALGQSKAGAEPSHRALAKIFGTERALIVLDNLEPLLPEAEPILRRLVAELPTVSWLMTSRVGLNLPGRREFSLDALPVPAPSADQAGVANCESVQLFLARAVRARPGFVLTDENAAAVGETCRIIGGMPLGLEIAAARLMVMTAEELRDALKESLPTEDSGDRLAEIFRWSRGLLPPVVAEFLGDLTVFCGGWTTDAARVVAQMESRQLTLAYQHYLVSCSLIRTGDTPFGLRFFMAEPVRQLAGGTSDRLSAAEARHRDHFRELARRTYDASQTAAEEAVFREAEPEVANILAAVEREPEPKRRLRTAISFHPFALYRGCNRRLRDLLAEPETLAAAAPGDRGYAWHAVGILALAAGDSLAGRQALENALAGFEASGDVKGTASAQYNLASLVANEGRVEEACRISSESLNYFREMGDSLACATILDGLACWSLRLKRFDDARRYVTESLEICEKSEFAATGTSSLLTLAGIEFEAGHGREALPLFQKVLDLQVRLGLEKRLPYALAALADLLVANDCLEDAARFARAAREAEERFDAPLKESDTFDFAGTEALLARRLAPDVLARFTAIAADESPAEWAANAKKLQVSDFAA